MRSMIDETIKHLERSTTASTEQSTGHNDAPPREITPRKNEIMVEEAPTAV